MKEIEYVDSYFTFGESGPYGMRIFLHVDGDKRMKEILSPLSKWCGPDKTIEQSGHTWKGYEFEDAFGKAALQVCEAGCLHVLTLNEDLDLVLT